MVKLNAYDNKSIDTQTNTREQGSKQQKAAKNKRQQSPSLTAPADGSDWNCPLTRVLEKRASTVLHTQRKCIGTAYLKITVTLTRQEAGLCLCHRTRNVCVLEIIMLSDLQYIYKTNNDKSLAQDKHADWALFKVISLTQKSL